MHFCAELEPEITIVATTLESCLELLIPPPERFSIPEAEKAVVEGPSNDTERSSTTPVGLVKESEDARRRETGIIDPVAHSITVTLKSGDYYYYYLLFKNNNN